MANKGYYPTNEENGEPTYREREVTVSEIVGVRLNATIVGNGGFALQNLATGLTGNFTDWKKTAANSRLQHPALFDVDDDVSIPSNRRS